MPITKTLHVTTREEWRAWLAKHHATETEVWLIYYKKQSGQSRIPYDDAVEEALCFGWIDSIVKKIDEEKYAQKFTPRRERLKWSPSNKRRMRKLIEEGRMTEVGLAKIDLVVLHEDEKEKPKQRTSATPDIPPFVEQALRANPAAWKHFQDLAPSHRRNYIRWIIDAKREETRQRRLREVVSLLEQNKRLGLK
jgi:uncharacterized protein YdeI (YjbR/CyaY-like superfamily)